MTRPAVILCLFAFIFVGCKKSGASRESRHATSPQEGKELPKINACALLTKEEVGSVQGTTIFDTRSSEQTDGTLRSAQCFYSAMGPNLSVSLEVIQADPANPNAPSIRDYWKNTFEHPEEGEKGEEEKKIPPRKIEGLGDEALWVADRVGGALYVLHQEAIIRISVGGPNNADTKLEKSKALAALAIARLPK